MIIGISGKAGSGKDTVGRLIQLLIEFKDEPEIVDSYIKQRLRVDYINSEYYDFKIMKFATKLKKFISDVLGISVEDLEDPLVKSTILGSEWGVDKPDGYMNYSPRDLLQLVGTNVCRVIHKNFWVNALFSEYKSTSNWIVTDVRFQNEAKAITDRGGIMIRVNRIVTPEYSKEMGFLSCAEHRRFLESHPSETDLDTYSNFHYRIDNDSSLEQLAETIKPILNELKLT